MILIWLRMIILPILTIIRCRGCHNSIEKKQARVVVPGFYCLNDKNPYQVLFSFCPNPHCILTARYLDSKSNNKSTSNIFNASNNDNTSSRRGGENNGRKAHIYYPYFSPSRWKNSIDSNIGSSNNNNNNKNETKTKKKKKAGSQILLEGIRNSLEKNGITLQLK